MPLETKYTVRTTEGKRSLREMATEFRRFSKETGRHLADTGEEVEEIGRKVDRLQPIINRVKRLFAGAFAFMAIKKTTGALIGVNAQMERYNATLKTVLGSQEAATSKLDFIREFAATTPFQLPDLVEATVKLEAYGITAETVLGTLGDTAAAMGKDINQAVEAIADAQTGEFERLKEFGIKSVQEAGRSYLLYVDRFGKEQKALIDRNNRDIITSTVTAIWNERYAGAMRERAQTFEGIVSNLKDIAFESSQQLGRGLFESVKGDLKDLLDTINEFRESGQFAAIGSRISEGLAKAYETIKDIIRALREYGPTLVRVAAVVAAFKVTMLALTGVFKAYNVVIGIAKGIAIAYRSATLLLAAAKAILTGNIARATAAMRVFNMTVRLSPIGLVISALAAAATAFVIFRDRTRDATEAQEEFQRKLKESIAAIREMSGAMLRAREVELGTERSEAELRIKALERQYRMTEASDFSDIIRYDPNLQANVILKTGEEIRAEKLAEINEKLEEQRAILRGIDKQELEIRRQLSENLNVQIAYLEAKKGELVATGEESEELTRIKAQLEELIELRNKLAGTATGDVIGGGVPDNIPEIKESTLERLRALIQSYADAQELIAADLDVRSRIEELQGLSDEIRDLEKRIADFKTTTGGEKELFDLEKILGNLKGQREQLRERLADFWDMSDFVDDLIRSGELKLEPLPLDLDTDLLVSRIADVNALLARVARETTEVNIALGFGDLTPEAAQERLTILTDEVREKLRGIYDAFKDVLPPEVVARIESFLSGLRVDTGNLNKDLMKTAETFRSIATAGRAMLRLADTLGRVSDELRRVAEGALDAVDNFAQLEALSAAGASTAQMAIPAVGMFAGVATFAFGLFDALSRRTEAEAEATRQRRETNRELIDALRDNARKVSEAIQRYTEAAMQGESFTGTDADTVRSLVADFDRRGQLIEDRRWLEAQLAGEGLSDTVRESLEQALAEIDRLLDDLPDPVVAFRDLLQGLDDLGAIDYYDVYAIFQGLLASGETVESAIAAILEGTAEGMDVGLRALLETLENVGEFGNNVDGAIAALRLFTRFVDKEASVSFERFLADLLTKVADLPPLLREKLEEIQGLDITSEEDRATLAAIIAEIATRFPAYLAEGSIDREDLEAILEELLGFAEGGYGGVAGESASATFSRSITEVQANMISAYLEEVAFWDRRTAEAVEKILAVLSPPTGKASGITGISGLPIEVDLSALSQIERPFALPATSSAPASNIYNLNLDSVDLHADGRLSNQQITDLVRRFMPELLVQLEREIRLANMRSH